jgi:hypothetical protein
MDEKPLTPKEAIEKARALRDQTDKPAVVWYTPKRGFRDVGLGKLQVLTAYDERPSPSGIIVYWVSRNGTERPMEDWAHRMPSLEEESQKPAAAQSAR